MIVTVKEEVGFKSGRKWEKHKRINIRPHETHPSLVTIDDGEMVYSVHVDILKSFKEIQWPTISEIENMIYDGDCTTPAGNIVDPDGHDSEGWPSWLIMLGFI